MRRFLLVSALCGVALHAPAVEATDLVGTWTVDVDATWDKLKALPQVAALPPDQVGMVKATLEDQLRSTEFTFTADTLTSTSGGVQKQEKFQVTKTQGDTLFTTDTSADQKVTHSSIQVSPTRLTITNMDQPGEVVVLQRKPSAPDK